MKELDATIGGLYEQTAHAQKALADLKSGHHNIETRTNETLGLTITVARQKSKTVSELSFLTAVRTARGIGKQEGISEIFACK